MTGAFLSFLVKGVSGQLGPCLLTDYVLASVVMFSVCRVHVFMYMHVQVWRQEVSPRCCSGAISLPSETGSLIGLEITN